MKRRKFIFYFFVAMVSCSDPDKRQSKAPNVLMICVDDLRPELGCYDNPIIHTPNIDLLASKSVLFKNHYVQAALCSPSRSMLLTGKFQQTWDIWQEDRRGSKEPKHPIALPHLFKKNGYNTVGIGKISHPPGGVMDDAQKIPQIPFSWDTTYTAIGKWKTPWRAFFAYANGDAHNTAMKIGEDTPHIPYERGDVDDLGYPDGLNAQEAVTQLRKLKKGNKPFFLAVGFYKPHLPFNAPKKYWDLYDRDKIPIAKNNFIPKNSNEHYCSNKSTEVTTHYPWPGEPNSVSADQAKTLKHGYYASVSYVDAQIGKVLDELKAQGLEKNTIVVLWSDHGWHLGEHGMFGKMTNFNTATNSPLIIRVPDMENNGEVSEGIVETLDIYPTLADLCGFKTPSDLDGKSFVSLLQNPKGKGRPYARSFYYRNNALGKSLRTEQYRIVRWATEQDSVVAIELYDQVNDPDENVNVAKENPQMVEQLSNLLKSEIVFEPNTPFIRWQ